MVKPTQDWQGKHAPYALGVARNRRVLLQRKVRTSLVATLVNVEQMTKMLLAKDHQVIEAVPPDRSQGACCPSQSWADYIIDMSEIEFSTSATSRFADLRRRILSWWRRTRISACNAARGRKSPGIAH
jgi:hypothetical protein